MQWASPPRRRNRRINQWRTNMQTHTNDAATRIAKARAELILSHTFYGVLVSQVTPVASRQFPTMATNGTKHFYNPEFIAKLTPAELLGVQAHETEHDARRHHTRRNGRDPEEWNIACDYAINIDLINAGFVLPKDALIDPKYLGWSAEDIYRARELDRRKQEQQQQQQPQQPQESGDDGDQSEGGEDESEPQQQDGDQGDDGDDTGNEAGDEAGDDEADGQDEEGDDDGKGSGQGQGDDGDEGQGEGSDGDAGDADGEGKGSGSGDAEGTEGGAGSEPQSSGDPGGCGEVLDASEEPAELADQDGKWEQVLRQAAMLAAKRGDAPGHVTREVARCDHPPQDWRDALRDFFDGGATNRETWSRPNRRFIGSGLYLPGSERDGVNRAAFLVDTSGSMDEIALAAIAVETQAALDERIIDELVVIYGDTRVTRVDTYRSGDEIVFDPRGGGGTRLMPLFDYVRDEVDQASLIVCFTDAEHEITSQNEEPACPVLFAITGYPDKVRGYIANTPWNAPGIDVGSH